MSVVPGISSMTMYGWLSDRLYRYGHSRPTGDVLRDFVGHPLAADALVAVASPLARKVEMHRSVMAGGVMSMQRQAQVAVPAGGAVRFAPGGHHLMFLGLTRSLKAGDGLPATLTFASGAKLNVTFAVGTGIGPPAPHHH